MAGSFRLGKLFGIDIYLHVSWLLLLVLLTWSLATGWFAQAFPGWSVPMYWGAALISSFLLFVGVLLHEMGHSLVASAYKIPVKSITLLIFGGVSDIAQEPKRPGVEFQMAIVGPLVSLLLGGLFFLLLLPFRGDRTPVAAVLEYLAIMNTFLGIINLLPGFPLDGGRVLRSIVWKMTGSFQKATNVATFSGQVFGFLLILLGLLEFFNGNFFGGLWTAFIGWFLLSAAQSTRMQTQLQSTLQGITAQQVMNPYPVTVPANISLQKLVDEYIIPQGLNTVPVMRDAYLIGLITLNDVARVPSTEWSITPVGHVMRPAEQIVTTTPQQPLMDVLQTMVSKDIKQVPVVLDGRLLGMVSRDSVIRYVQLHHSTGGKEPQAAA